MLTPPKQVPTEALSEVFFTPSSSLSSVQTRICRICHVADGSLIRPCRCCGSMAFVHEPCLQRWASTSKCERCQVCRGSYAKSWPRLKSPADWKRPSCSLLLGVLLVLLLLSYHVWALHLSSVSATLSTAHLVVFALMLAVDLLVLAAMLTMYLRAQCTQRYTNRKGNSGPQKV